MLKAPKLSLVPILTDVQANLVRWMVETTSDQFVLVETHGPAAFLIGTPAGERHSVDASDVRELLGQQLIRNAGGKSYELSNQGRLAYQELTTPPCEPPPVGFGPPA